MNKREFDKYATMGIGIARTMQKIELFEKICEICKDEPKTAREIAEELINNGYKYTTKDYYGFSCENKNIKTLTQTIAGMICSDQTKIKKFFEITNTPEEAILLTDAWTNETYAVKTSVHLYKFIG